MVNGIYEDYGIDAEPTAAAEQAGVTLRPGEAEVLAEAADFRRHRIDLQTDQVARLSEVLPLPQVRLPFLFESEIGSEEVDVLARSVLGAVQGLDAEVQLGSPT